MERKQQLLNDLLDSYDGDVNQAILELCNESKSRATERTARQQRAVADEVVIDVTDLKKQYKIGKQSIAALNGVSLQIHKGEFVALMGPSGSGKSTLLQLIGGLDKPTGGSVVVQGQDLVKLSDSKISEFRSRTIGFVFQFFYLQPFLRLGQNLEIAGMPARLKPKDRQTRVQALAEIVGLSDRLKHFPKELSGGQMQRAAIARALLNQPEIILADEPTGNLDSVNGKAIIDLFEKIRDDFGTTIVVVTHDEAIGRRADRAIRLADGVVV